MPNIARPDFNRIWSGIVAFIAAIDFPDEVEVLATARDAPTFYETNNPDWTVERGELDAIEDLAPIIRVDMLDWPHDEADTSGDAYVQYWRMELAIGIAALSGSDEGREDAITRYFDICSVLVNEFMGSGAEMGLDKAATGLEHAVLTGGRWASGAKGDQFICSGFMLLRVRCRWAQTTS